MAEAQVPTAADLLVRLGPVIPVKIEPYTERESDPEDLPEATYQALIDTGATRSSIDLNLAKSIGLTPIGNVEMIGIGGKVNALRYLAQLHIPALHCTLHGEFAGVDLPEGETQIRALLGRDILRHFSFNYDGATGNLSLGRPW